MHQFSKFCNEISVWGFGGLKLKSPEQGDDSVNITVLVLKMAHRKWKEFKQQPSTLPGPAVPGGCLVSFHILWAILSTSTVNR